MKAIIVLLDSLNRHMLPDYNPTSNTRTPCISAFAEDSVQFQNHFIGSAPCMPARRDIFTGRLNFLERGWGPIEPFDVTLPKVLAENNIFSHIITDHHHYFETGGENYCQQFTTYDFIRGQEYDPYVSCVSFRRDSLPNQYGIVNPQYEKNRTLFRHEEDYPTPRVFAAACDWLEQNKGEDDFLLMVEAFDPHEPFDCPDEYLAAYNTGYEGWPYIWSSYSPVTEPPEAIEDLRAHYMATVTMTDHWFGKMLGKLRSLGMYEDTLIILTTDHGHLLGEHGFTGKNYTHVYNELSHIPLWVKQPGGRGAGEKRECLTQNIDLMPTLLEYFGIPSQERVTGEALTSCLQSGKPTDRQAVIYGWFGRSVNICDGEYTYFRVPDQNNFRQCYHYCAVPTTLKRFLGTSCQDDIVCGCHLYGSDYPVCKIPAFSEKEYPLGAQNTTNYLADNLLFRLDDARQITPLKDTALEDTMVQKLKQEMIQHHAPDEQFLRLGIAE